MAETSREFDEKLPKRSKIAYAIANSANGVLSGLGLGQIMYFYTEKLHQNPELQGIAWLLFAAWNAINDPLLGILEERTKSKLGRRVPYLRYGAPIYVVLFILVWFPFASPGDEIGLFINFLAMLFLFDTVYSMIGLITYSLPAEMTVTSKERGSIMIYSTVFGLVSQVLGFVLPLSFLQPESASVPFWQGLMLITAVACGIALYISSYFIKENRYAQKEPTLGFIDSIKESIKNKPFLVFEVTNFAAQISQTVLMGGLMYVFRYVIITQSWLDYLYFGPVILVLIVTVLVFNRLISKAGIKKIFIYGNLCGVIGFGMLPLFGRHLSGLFIPLVFIAVWLASYIMTGQPLMADVIDHDEVLTGKRRETTYAGVNALITKPAISIANWLFLSILAAFGYISQRPGEPAPVQPASVADGVIIAFTIVPAVCGLIAILAMKWFTLDGPAWADKKEQLKAIHARKEQDYIDSLRKEGKI
nr:MFS transporter [Candidatus Sigynarchaeota archaeon]